MPQTHIKASHACVDFIDKKLAKINDKRFMLGFDEMPRTRFIDIIVDAHDPEIDLISGTVSASDTTIKINPETNLTINIWATMYNMHAHDLLYRLALVYWKSAIGFGWHRRLGALREKILLSVADGNFKEKPNFTGAGSSKKNAEMLCHYGFIRKTGNTYAPTPMGIKYIEDFGL